MIVHGCIEIHPKGCGGWIIVMGFRVLLIIHYLIREILLDGVLDVHARDVKIKDLDVVTMHLLQNEFMEKYMCWYAHGELYVPRDTMVERMVASTSSSSNVHGVVYDNSNHYRNMIMDAMRMIQGHVGQCPIIDEKPNADATKVFDLLEDSNKPL
jgi:hypothetical protein